MSGLSAIRGPASRSSCPPPPRARPRRCRRPARRAARCPARCQRPCQVVRPTLPMGRCSHPAVARVGRIQAADRGTGNVVRRLDLRTSAAPDARRRREPAGPESLEDYYARIMAAADAGAAASGRGRGDAGLGHLPLRARQPAAQAAPAARRRGARRGAGRTPRTAGAPRVRRDDGTLVWSNPRWQLGLPTDIGPPDRRRAQPFEHHDCRACRDLAGRGDGRSSSWPCPTPSRTCPRRPGPARQVGTGPHRTSSSGPTGAILQLRGSPLIDWEENLPRVPLEVLRPTPGSSPSGSRQRRRHGGTPRAPDRLIASP